MINVRATFYVALIRKFMTININVRLYHAKHPTKTGAAIVKGAIIDYGPWAAARHPWEVLKMLFLEMEVKRSL